MVAPLLGPAEFRERYAGRYYAKYQGVVKNNQDPKMLGRVQVLCRPLYGETLSPWARPNWPGGVGIDTGQVWVPPVDSLVWVECEEGHPSAPIYSGGFPKELTLGRFSDGTPIEERPEYQDLTSPIPAHAQGIPDGYDYDGSSRGVEGVPPTSFAGRYPDVRVLRTPGGHCLEFDDTPGSERVVLQHSSGAFIEILPDGSITIASEGRVTTRARSTRTMVAGSTQEVVAGSASLDVAGDFVVNVGGAYRVSYGKEATVSKPSERVEIAGNLEHLVGGTFSVEALNSVAIEAGAELTMGCVGNSYYQVGGYGALLFSNALNAADPTAETLNIVAQNGRLKVAATDRTGVLANFGLEIQPQGTTALTPTPLLGSLGPHVFLGNLQLPRLASPTLLLQESVPLGQSLVAYLQALTGFLQTWLTDYLLHAHPPTSPAYTSPAMLALLPPTLASIQSTFLLPTGPKLNPLLLSDVVFVSKQ